MNRYRRYDGGDPLAPPVDLAEALDAIGQDVMAGYSPERAMSEFLRRGGADQRGLDDLARRLAERRREILERHDLGGTMRQVRELLDKAVTAERGQLARDITMDDDDRAFRELQLGALPESTAAAVTELSSYDWQSTDAREAYEQIKDLLGRELLDQRFAGMKQALEGATDEDRAAVQEMLSDLNDLLEKHQQSDGSPESRAEVDRAFEQFMAKHGDWFPENPATVDELVDALAQRAAAAQRMLASMTPEQRAELAELSQQAFGSPGLVEQLARMDGNLQSLRPGEDWSGSESFEGGEGLGLGDGTGALQDLAQLDALSDQLSQSYGGARLDDIDLDALARQLGDEAVVDARALQELERALRDSGYLKRGSDGELRLSPKAMRQLGKALLRDVADRMSGRAGARESRTTGLAGEPSGATRRWEFGGTEPWDVPRTITNAVLRDGGGSPLRITIDDVEVVETEARTQAAVALLVDTSFSMAMDGRWVPMKRTALALHQLIRSRFRGDHLELIGFGRHAEVMEIEQLTALDARWAKGTNLHHALLLANRFFRKHPNAQPVLLVVTDGEPTAHLEPDGEVWFSYPPDPVTIAHSVRELDGSARLGAQVTFFRLGEDPGLARFIESMARRVGGRMVSPELDDLGAAVVGSYLGSRGPGTSYRDHFGDWNGGRGFWV
ncbi:VWA domain-containing protein [Knoellia sp. LjRoot47]|uniref:VWA domain-containing protein n=1 Tax=Knoellia sp. LjRoot47 TaxID=3342330 RepID=UPI003ECC7285